MSDILIKGMEMPTSCRKCMISKPDGCGWICPIIESKPIVDGRVNSRHPRCPLVTVPSHGRLGNLDELYTHLNEWYLTHSHCFTKEEAIYIRAMLLGIADAPTIIPASGGQEDE